MELIIKFWQFESFFLVIWKIWAIFSSLKIFHIGQNHIFTSKFGEISPIEESLLWQGHNQVWTPHFVNVPH
jgi:hypothetical protein